MAMLSSLDSNLLDLYINKTGSVQPGQNTSKFSKGAECEVTGKDNYVVDQLSCWDY